MNAVYTLVEIWYDLDLCVDDEGVNLKKRGVFKDIGVLFRVYIATCKVEF